MEHPYRNHLFSRSTAADVALVVAILVSIASPARSTNQSFYGVGFDATVTFDKNSLTSNTSSAFNWNNTNNISPTDINPVVTTNSSQQKEIEVWDDDYGDTWWVGIYSCWTFDASWTRCQVGHVQINLKNINPPNNLEYAKAVLCHEIGHSVGLAHREAAGECMVSMPITSKQFLSSHDVAHINAGH